MLYACFDILQSNIVMDLSWQHALNDFYMPYRVQQQRFMLDKITVLKKEVKEQVKKDSAKEGG